MGRAKAVSLFLEGAIGFRSLPLSFLAGAFLLLPTAQAATAAPSAPAELMQRWRGYALSRITPDYSWAERPAGARAPTVLDQSDISRASFSIALGHDTPYTLSVDLRSTGVGSRVRLLDDSDDTATLLRDRTSPLRGSLAHTGVNGRFGEDGLFGVSVVLAHQRFAAPTLDGYSFAASMPQVGAQALAETSHGAGVEVDVTDRLASHLNWYAGARSRISMDAFQNYRGIYGNPGDMDIPASMRLGFEWAPVADTRLRLGVDRIMYSEIQPFVSAALPRRLLAVLGDGTSPVFSWRDLDIYSVTLLHDLNANSRLSLRYSTRQQPLPTSELLSRLLMEQAADYALGLGYSRDAGPGQWRFVANYAPSEFVLGIPTSARADRSYDGRQLEFEALWTMPF
jgi:hypothetical protein